LHERFYWVIFAETLARPGALMGDRILEIVVHLMDHIRDNQGRLAEMEGVVSELKNLGYTDNEISSAYSWLLERFDVTDNTFYSNFPEQHFSTRILTNFERYQLTTDAHGFLIKLLHHGLIDDEQFESILERGGMFSPKPVTLDQIKLISSAVVFRDPRDADNFSWLESKAETLLDIN
jgi:uncharacterized protein Smg (DUF494 family)